MTSSPVKSAGALLNYVSSKPTGNMQEELAGNFTDAFSKATGQQNMMLQNDNAVKSTSQVKVNHTDRKGLDEKNTVKTEVKTSKTTDTQTEQKFQDEVQKAGEELVSKVAEQLGVSEEAVTEAMETLGLTMVDLLNPDNMTQLLLTIEGTDMLSLMTDEGLYNSLQNLLGMVEQQLKQLQEDLGISPEELTALVEQTTAKDETLGQTVDVLKEQLEQQDGQDDYTVTVERNGEVMKVSVEVDGNSKTENAEVTSQKVEVPEEEIVKADAKEDGSKNGASAQGNQTQTNMLLEQLLNCENAVTKPDATFQNTMAGSTVNTQDIMNQIMNYMKIQVKTDMTQMQIQLHPASLGTVNVNIASKEGVITAQFLTQNETVKAVIESQIVQLKNNFEEQGIKVEAVEVTVESHAFERNLSGEGNSRQQSQDGKKKGTRKLNLNELNAEEEAKMDEAEQIAVAMMSAGGNTVDFTA
jgi:flagellar hook-length control protein FliK